jgi:predicted MFS family arabinose efflux permease
VRALDDRFGAEDRSIDIARAIGVPPRHTSQVAYVQTDQHHSHHRQSTVAHRLAHDTRAGALSDPGRIWRPRFANLLAVPGYRWLMLGGVGSSAAFTIDALATGWLVLQLTDSAFWLGVVAGTRGISQLLFSVVGGTIADRIDLRRVLVQNAVVSAALAMLVLVLVMTGAIQLWLVLAVQVVAGLLQAMGGPANQALLYDVVGPARLLSARAISFMTMGTARIAASLVGGFVLSRIGTGEAFGLVAAAYLFGATWLVRLPHGGRVRPAESPFRSLVAGLRFATRDERIRELLLLSFTTEAFGFAHMPMVPAMARDVLHVGADGLGLLTACSAAGQLGATVLLASFGDVRRKDLLLLGSAFGYGAAIVAFGLSPWFAFSLLAMAFVGGFAGVYDSTIATVIQLTVRGEMRGRILGLYVASWGSNPVGTFGLGAFATVVGIPFAISGFAAVVCVNALRLAPKRGLFDPVRPEDGAAPVRA